MKLLIAVLTVDTGNYLSQSALGLTNFDYPLRNLTVNPRCKIKKSKLL